MLLADALVALQAMIDGLRELADDPEISSATFVHLSDQMNGIMDSLEESEDTNA